ncbi:class I SAM-dependent methyltransferase [Methanophagales archaeon]|nr:MAG: class I SAM-dependent methyltransferase [Methanophagales archaeon]
MNFDYKAYYEALEENIDHILVLSAQTKHALSRRYETIISLIGDDLQKGKVLDVGSAQGYLTVMLLSKKYDVISLDISPLRVIKVKDRAANRGLNPNCIAADALDLPFVNGSLDVIVAGEVLEHLTEPEKALNEFYRILKPKGILIVTVPNDEKISYQVCIHCHKLTPSSGHLHSFDDKKLTRVVEQAGFNVLRIKKVFNPLNSFPFIYKLFVPLPYPIWNIADTFLNKFIKFTKPRFLLIKAEKAT